VALVGSVTAAVVALAEDDPVVILANDFEDGSVAPWQGRGAATVAITPGGHDSENALAVTGRTANWHGVQTDAMALFQPGVTYTISAWVKLPTGTEGSVGINFAVHQPDAPDNEFPWIGGRADATADEWVQIGGTYSLPAGQTEATLYIEAADDTSSFLVDDVLITAPTTGPAPGIVHSTSFEDGLDGWIPREAGETGHTVTISTEQAHTGAASALISGRDSQGDGIGLDIAPITEQGVTYDLTAWVRFAPGAETDEIWLSLASTTGSSTAFATLGQFTNVTNDGWTRVQASFVVPAADTSLLYFETRWQGEGIPGNTSDFYVDDIVLEVPAPPVVQDITPLKDTVDFPLGVAIDSRETLGAPSELLLRHFDRFTPENHMKPEAWYDDDRNFRPHSEAIALMDYAAANNLPVYGHVLLWHSQVPAWFFQDADGNPLTNSAADQQVLRDRLRTHIFNVAEWLATTYGEFGAGNPVAAFDVVNEVISDGTTDPGGLRQSEWYRILGESFIDLAFEYADEAFNQEYAAAGAGRPVKLFINDYNTEVGDKQERYRALVDRLLARGVPLDGVGHQFHVSVNMPIGALAAALNRFADLDGLVQAVTELDVTVGTPVNQARLIEQGHYYRDAFALFRDYHATHGNLFSVTIWGLTDNRSWRSTQAPLVFDGGLQAKPAYYGITDPDQLPALERSAIVFGGDVALDGNAFTAIEWRQLRPVPLLNDAGSFSLRWVDGHLTVLATVASDEADALQFTYGGQVVTFTKANPGSIGVVNDEGAGWRAVVHLPHSGIAAGATGSFDIRVLDGDTVLGGWNSAGGLGILSYVEPLSYVEVVQASAAPTIDGVIDPLWSDATVVRTEKRIEGTTNAQADVRTLWRDDTLYVLMEVTDPVIDVTAGDPWQQDSVEIYVDAGNAKNGPYRSQDIQIRINADNVTTFGTGPADQADRVTSATARTATGYVVEVAIAMLDTNTIGAFHGLDFQVNDGSPREGQATGARTGLHNWADPTGTGYQNTSRWGVGQLVGPAGPSGPQLPNCTKTVKGLVLGNLKVTSGVTCLTSKAIVLGKVTVSPGASLISDGGVVIGTISATGAQWVDLRGGGTGPLSVSGTTAHLSLTDTVIAGAAQLTNNVTPGPIVVADNTVVGVLACSGNQPAPTNNGERNLIIGVATGQCRGL
jgi:endo-1,4-beta-xylanase